MLCLLAQYNTIYCVLFLKKRILSQSPCLDDFCSDFPAPVWVVTIFQEDKGSMTGQCFLIKRLKRRK